MGVSPFHTVQRMMQSTINSTVKNSIFVPGGQMQNGFPSSLIFGALTTMLHFSAFRLTTGSYLCV
jgi:hypothetical protein